MSQSPQYALDLSGEKPEVCACGPDGMWLPCVQPSQDSVEPWKDLVRFVRAAQGRSIARPTVPVLLPLDHVVFDQIEIPNTVSNPEAHVLATLGARFDQPTSQLACHIRGSAESPQIREVAVIAKATLIEAETIVKSLGFRAASYTVNKLNGPVFAAPATPPRPFPTTAIAASLFLIGLVSLAGYLAFPADETLLDERPRTAALSKETAPFQVTGNDARSTSQNWTNRNVINTNFVTAARDPKGQETPLVQLASLSSQVVTASKIRPEADTVVEKHPFGDTTNLLTKSDEPIVAEPTRTGDQQGVKVAALEPKTPAEKTAEGVTVFKERPQIVPPTRKLSSSIMRPRLRPGTAEAVETTPNTETASLTPATAEPPENTQAKDASNTEAQPTTPETVETSVEEPTEIAPATAETVDDLAASVAAVMAPLPTPNPAHTALKPRLRGGTEQVGEVSKEATEPTQTETAALPLPNPTLADKRPLPRPSGIGKDTALSLLDRANPKHRGKYAKRRPAGLRTTAVKPPAPEVPKPVDPAQIALTEIQIAEDIRQREEAARLARLSSSSRLAVRLSPVPRKKSSSFSRTVAQTNANIRKAALKPRATSNPDKPVKSGTTSTFGKNKLSLIGVYGTSSSRRALIRTQGGRYVKVKRGQRVSGWRVSAIGANTVRVTKGSRTRTLRLP